MLHSELSGATFLLLVFAVVAALCGNAIGAIWASGASKWSIWFWLLLLIGPLVFISFGLATTKLGVTIATGIIDALLTVGSLGIGLIFFREWDKISGLQYLGIIFSISGIALMAFFPKADAQ